MDASTLKQESVDGLTTAIGIPFLSGEQRKLLQTWQQFATAHDPADPVYTELLGDYDSTQAKKGAKASISTLGLTQSALQAIIDGAFAQTEASVSTWGWYGVIIKGGLQAIQGLIDANFASIYYLVMQSAVLTVNSLIDAIVAAVPGSGPFLLTIEPILDELIQQTAGSPTA